MPGSERSSDALRELGLMAAERREGANMTLEDIYDRTRIRPEYLRGIEEGNYTGFPEVVYTKGFVRTYLKVIGAEDLQEDFMAQLNRLQPQKSEPAVNVLESGTSAPEGFKPASHFWLFLVLLAALAGTGGYVWYAWSNGGFNLKDWRWPTFYQGGTASSDEQQGIVAEELSADVPAPVSEDKKPEPPAPPKPSLEIRAQGDVWLQVTIGNQVVYSQTLKQGNSVSWELPAQARVRFGRPSAARVILNGRDLGPVNPRPTKGAETYVYQPDGTYQKVNRK